jgi:hypothetical protein
VTNCSTQKEEETTSRGLLLETLGFRGREDFGQLVGLGYGKLSELIEKDQRGLDGCWEENDGEGSGVVTAVRTCDNLPFDCPLFLRGWRWGLFLL